MKLKNESAWNEYVSNNKDSYGGTCINVAKRVMELLDEDPTPLEVGYYPNLHTPHGLICKADSDIDAGGITGFMAGAVAQMVAQCHERGNEFNKAWNSEYGVTEDIEGTVNPAIVTLDI